MLSSTLPISAPWTTAERAAFRPPARQSVSEWAESEREIVSLDAAERGRWRNARAPYLRGVMDALSDPTVEEVYLMKAARVGGSEAGKNWLGRTIKQAPGPFLIVFPDEATAKRQLANEIEPLLKTDALKHLLTDRVRDISKAEIELRHMRIYPAWSGSPTTLAERTIQYVWLSEVDKFPPFSGREADPMSLAKTRTQTYGPRKKIYAESTPTTRNGAIARAFYSAPDRRRYWCPCPLCGAFQTLSWIQVKWPKAEPGEDKRALAVRVEAKRLAWYECEHCKGRIDESHKPHMLDQGEWRSEGQPASIVAFHISGLMSMLGLTWHRMAAKFLRALVSRYEGDIGPFMEFFTQILGEPFEDQVNSLKDGLFEAKRSKGHKPRTVPRWASSLVASVDTQRDGFWWVVRAWGRGERSRLIDRGRAPDFAGLEAALRRARYPIEAPWEAEFAPVRLLGIDSGGGGDLGSDRSLTDEVYRWCQRHPGWAYPLKGWGGMGSPKAPVTPSKVTYTPPGGAKTPYDVIVNIIDTQYFKDVLAGLIATEVSEGADERWEVCDDIDAEYVEHMTAEKKVAVRKAGGIVERWERQGQRANHLWDCEVMQLALARMIRVEMAAAPEALEATRAATVQQRAAPAQTQTTTRFSPSDGRAYLACRREPR